MISWRQGAVGLAEPGLARPRARLSLCLVGLLATALPRLVGAQGSLANSGVELTAVDLSPRAADPGSALTLLFRLRNRSQTRATVESRLELPGRWRQLIGPARIVLEPGQTAPQLLTIVVPGRALVGKYTVRYAAWAAADSGSKVTAAVTVVVREQPRLGLELIDVAHFVVAGERFVVTGLLRNLGNAPVTARLEAKGSPGLKLRKDSSTVHLGAGETHQLSFPIETRGGASGESIQYLWITATRIGEAGADSSVTARATPEIEIVGRARVGESRRHSVPLSLAVRRIGESAGGSSLGRDDTAELSGGGDLTEGGATRVDLFARRSRTTRSGLAVRDEFRFGLTSPAADLRIGDYSFDFSPLTETRRVATGAAVRAHRGLWSAGAFVIRDAGRGRAPLKEEAAFVGYRVKPGLQFSANALTRHGAGAGMVGSLGTVFNAAALGSFDLEAGLSSSPTSGSGFAWALRAHGAPGGFGYDIRRIQGDRSYVGRFQGARQDNLGLTTPTRYRLRLSGQISSQFVGEDVLLSHPDSLPGTTLSSQRSQSTTIGLAWQDLLQVERRTLKQEAFFAGQRLGGEETAFQARASARIGSAIRLSQEVARGKLRSAVTDPEQPFWRFAFRSQLSIGNRQSYGISVQRQSTAQSESTPAVEQTSFDLTGNLQLPTGTDLRLLGSVNRGPGYSLGGTVSPASFATAIYDAAVTQHLPLGHFATARVRSMLPRFRPSGRQTILQLEYRVPIGVPGGGSSTAGEVGVRVRDAETGRGVPNALVRLDGRPALTDGDGRVKFAGLVSREYYLSIDRPSLGVGRISDHDQPTPVQVAGNRTIQVAIAVTRAARITGKVQRWDYLERQRLQDTAGTAIVETGGLADMDIDLDNGVEVRRQVTDSDGAFAFTNLLPGRWTVRIVGGALPAFHDLVSDSTVVDLPAGGTEEVLFRVLPRARKIHIAQTPALTPIKAPPSRPHQPR